MVGPVVGVATSQVDPPVAVDLAVGVGPFPASAVGAVDLVGAAAASVMCAAATRNRALL